MRNFFVITEELEWKHVFVLESRLVRKFIHTKFNVFHSVYCSVLSRVMFSRFPSSQIKLHLLCTQYTPAGTG